MTAFDMGGPVNKVATLFAQTQVDTLPYLMGGVGVAICTPPIGMGIATLLAPKKYNVEEKEAGKAAILMGCVGITEGAIPFAANDPLRVIPSLIVGAVVGNIIPFLAGVLIMLHGADSLCFRWWKAVSGTLLQCWQVDL